MIQLKSRLAKAAVLVAAIAGASSAQAVIYTGSWDPVYGPKFPGLGWSATAEFDVPDACLAQADGSYSGGPCSRFAFLSADVSFYNAADPLRTTLETFHINNVSTVAGVVTVESHQVDSVASSGFFDEFVPDANGAAASIDGAGAYSFNLIMLSDRQAQLWWAAPSGITSACANDASEGADCGKSVIAAAGVFAPIPEPSTVLLVTAGLAGLAVFARRRRDAD